MHTETIDTLIVGAGLSGIYAAFLISRQNRSFVVLEARDRIGGRILCPEHRGFYSDLGPSWYWPDIQPKMAHLVEALELTGFRQFDNGFGRFQLPGGEVRTVGGFAMEPPSWRLSGGMGSLVAGLGGHLPENAIRRKHPVCRIEKAGAAVQVDVGELERTPIARFLAEKVILALPPRLTASTILFEPELPHELTQAMLKRATWMAGQAKFCALYDAPFWRSASLSGEAFSQQGPIGEFHDGSNDGCAPYGLTGFLGVPAAQRSHPRRLVEAMIYQLAEIYGRPAVQPTVFFYQDWAKERFTATEYDQPPMTEHPLYHPPAGRTAIWNGTVHFAGTETAEEHGGYLEGALAAAERAVMGL